MTLSPKDERSHLPDGDPWWGESWDFDFATADAGLGGYVRVGVLPNQRICWYWACVVGADRDLVMVVDHEVGPPRPGGLEIRSEGLWADHIVEEAFDHVSVGCEAFALRLDDPADAFAEILLGERTPFGFDLGWETDGPSVGLATGGYALPCRVVGEVLVGNERIELDAFGWRRHAWRVEDWWSRGWHSVQGRFADGRWFRYDGAVQDAERPRYRVDPVALAPVQVPSGDGRISHLHRALCRITDLADGRAGAAWAEHNDPPGESYTG